METNNFENQDKPNNIDDISSMLESDGFQEAHENVNDDGQQKLPNKSNIKSLIIILVAGIIFLGGISLLGGKKNNKTANNTQAEQLMNDSMNEARQQMGDDFYRAASGNSEIPIEPIPESENAPVPGTTNPVSPQQNPTPIAGQTPGDISGQAPGMASSMQPKETFVTVNLLSDVGRSNPFVPTVAYGGYATLPNVPSMAPIYPAPPTTIIEDKSATNLLKTTISGIMYDAFSPSAIISIEGQDHMVRKGDRINGYRIVDITKDRVIVQNGTNIYRASVGETLVTQQDDVNFNNVYNLQQKFGGRNAARGTTMIQIN